MTYRGEKNSYPFTRLSIQGCTFIYSFISSGPNLYSWIFLVANHWQSHTLGNGSYANIIASTTVNYVSGIPDESGYETFKMHLDLGKSFRPMTPIQITRRFIHVCINTFICIYIYMYTQYIRIYSIQDASSVEYLPTFTRNLSQNTSKCAIFMEHLGILSTSILHST